MTRQAKLYPYKGRMLSASAISGMTGIAYSTIRHRARIGVPVDQPSKSGPKPRLYPFRDRMLSVREIEAELGLSESATRNRIIVDKVLEDADLAAIPKEPISTALLISHAGETLTASEWARRKGLNVYTLHSRLYKGWDAVKAITTPSAGVALLKRNRRIVAHIAATFRQPHAQHHQTGGYDPFSQGTKETGAWSIARDLQSEKSQ